MPNNTGANYTLIHPAPGALLAALGRAPLVPYWKNFLLEFQVQAHPLGAGPAWAGWDVTLRQALPDGDIVAIDEGGSNLRISERVAGTWFVRASYVVNWQANRWYTVRAKLQDAALTLWLDGTQVLSYGSLAALTPGYLLFADAGDMEAGHRTYRVTRFEGLP